MEQNVLEMCLQPQMNEKLYKNNVLKCVGLVFFFTYKYIHWCFCFHEICYSHKYEMLLGRNKINNLPSLVIEQQANHLQKKKL